MLCEFSSVTAVTVAAPEPWKTKRWLETVFAPALIVAEPSRLDKKDPFLLSAPSVVGNPEWLWLSSLGSLVKLDCRLKGADTFR